MQQVNLYLPEFRPKLDLLSAKYMALGYILVIVVLVIMQFGAIQKRNILAAEEVAVTDDVKNIGAKIARLKSLPKAADKSKMEESLALTQAAIHNREYAQKIIQSKNLGNDKGFSPALVAIASLSLQEVVLTEFSLALGGRQVELQGISKRSDAIPQYLQKLQNNAAFAQSEFGVLQLEKSAVAGQVVFRLGKPLQENKNKTSQGIAPNILSLIGR